MNKVGKIEFKRIKRVSPSQFYSMKNCAYKSLLAEAFDKKPLLPISANAYFGTVLHKMLEFIVKGTVTDEREFDKEFDEQVKKTEQDLMQKKHGFLVPLQKSVRDFGIKKILLKKHLRSDGMQKSITPTSTKFHSEKWVESKDKLIAGKIDLVIETEKNIEIVDFKTGEITEDIMDDSGEFFTDVKQEYKDQLKLYAYLFFESTGKFPTKLSLVDLAKQKASIDFSQSECGVIFSEAKGLLQSTNDSILGKDFKANPSEVNCKYCFYRPACSFFHTYVQSVNSFNDVSGLISKVKQYNNGNVNINLTAGDRLITVTGFLPEQYDELKTSISKKICIYNLRKEATEFVYSVTKTTMIYE